MLICAAVMSGYQNARKRQLCQKLRCSSVRMRTSLKSVKSFLMYCVFLIVMFSFFNAGLNSNHVKGNVCFIKPKGTQSPYLDVSFSSIRKNEESSGGCRSLFFGAVSSSCCCQGCSKAPKVKGLEGKEFEAILLNPTGLPSFDRAVVTE